MTDDERRELEELRAYKAYHSSKARTRAFAQLRDLLDLPAFDPGISRRAFRVIGDCLICLNDAISQGDEIK